LGNIEVRRKGKGGVSHRDITSRSQRGVKGGKKKGCLSKKKSGVNEGGDWLEGDRRGKPKEREKTVKG